MDKFLIGAVIKSVEELSPDTFGLTVLKDGKEYEVEITSSYNYSVAIYEKVVTVKKVY